MGHLYKIIVVPEKTLLLIYDLSIYLLIIPNWYLTHIYNPMVNYLDFVAEDETILEVLKYIQR